MIWLIGCAGMLGRELAFEFGAAGVPFIGTDRELDCTDASAVEDFAVVHRPEWIVNCAAYTAVDRAEDEQAVSHKLNVDIPRNIGAAATKIGARVLHLSTDYVFGGSGIFGPSGERRAYAEDDEVEPRSVYGATKAEGERVLLAACHSAVVIRTSWLYGAYGPNFVYTMLKLMRSRETLGVVGDQWGSPTWTVDLSRAILVVVNSQKPTFGIYHYSGEGICSWHQFAVAIEEEAAGTGLLQKRCRVSAITTDEYPTKALRPAWSPLDKSKIRIDYRLQIPDWRTSLKKFLVVPEVKKRLGD